MIQLTISQSPGYKYLWLYDLKFHATNSPQRQHVSVCSACPSGLLHTALTGTTSNQNGSDHRIWGCVLWKLQLHWEQHAVQRATWTRTMEEDNVFNDTEHVFWILATSRARRLDMDWRKHHPGTLSGCTNGPATLRNTEALYILVRSDSIWEPGCGTGLPEFDSWLSLLESDRADLGPLLAFPAACFPNCVKGIVQTAEACSGYQITLWA